MVLTGRGGIQAETTVLKVLCRTLRVNTERPVTCEIETNVLAGTDPRRIVEEAKSVLAGKTRPAAVPERSDEHAPGRMVEVLLNQATPETSTTPSLAAAV